MYYYYNRLLLQTDSGIYPSNQSLKNFSWSISKQICFKLAFKRNQVIMIFFLILSYCLPFTGEKARGFTPDPPLELCHGTAVKLAVLPHHYLLCKIIEWSFFIKHDIWKLKVLSKTDISKSSWAWLWEGEGVAVRFERSSDKNRDKHWRMRKIWRILISKDYKHVLFN